MWISLTQARYVELLGKQRNQDLRNEMKRYAHAAMYSGSSDMLVWLPHPLIEGLDDADPSP